MKRIAALLLAGLVLSLIFSSLAIGEARQEPYTFMGIPWESFGTDEESFLKTIHDASGLTMEFSESVGEYLTHVNSQTLTFAGWNADRFSMYVRPPDAFSAEIGQVFAIDVKFFHLGDIVHARSYSSDMDDDEEIETYYFNLPSLYTAASLIKHLEQTYQQPTYVFIICDSFKTGEYGNFDAQYFKISTPITSDTLHTLRKLCFERDNVDFWVVHENIQFRYSFSYQKAAWNYAYLTLEALNPTVDMSDFPFDEVADYQELPLINSPVDYFDSNVIDMAKY